MRRTLLVALTLALVAPSTSAALGWASDDVEAPAAGPGTGLRYAERFQADGGWQETTRIVTVEDPDEVTDARGEPRDAVPVTVQRRAADEVLAAERCWAAADAPSTVQREPITDALLASPLQRAWQLSEATPARAFERLPAGWPSEDTASVFDPRPCTARGPGTAIDLAGPGSTPLERLLPGGLPIPEAATLEGDARVEEAAFHGREARWVNATFHLRLPGPLPASGDGLHPGPLLVDGRTATLWADGLPGPAERAVDLDLRAPEAPGYGERLAWQVELTGHRPGDTEELGPLPAPREPDRGDAWTADGPATSDYETSFPLEQAVSTLEERGPRHQAYRLDNPDAFVRSATYSTGASPAPTDRLPGPVSVRGPAWTVEFTDPSGEAYRGAVLETRQADTPVGDARPSRSLSHGPNDSSRFQAWESPTDERTWPTGTVPHPNQLDPLASGEEVRERLERLGVPSGPLDGLRLELHAPQAGAGPQATVELAVELDAPAGVSPETVRAIVDGETGRPIAISDATREPETARLPAPVPATLVDDGAASDGTSAPSLPDGPAAGAGLAAGAALVWLLLVGLKTLLSPLFTRISRDELLENPTRRELLETIREDPGVHLQRLIEGAGVGNGATRHHLEKLADADLVQVIRHGGYVRFFPAGELSEREARQQATLRSGSTREVYEAIREDPGQSVRELAERLDMSSSGVHRLVRKLREVGLIDE